ncbi:hypothetical protein M0R72_09270 [Candidatus Pacearchaeota archaeon]|jgi:hypothetical protein|nr:hypothetical protein [Candidatus Pacearchaeota archaeon]
MTSIKIKSIKVEKVMSVYSGRPGCCCGCRGKHTDASWAPVKHEERGRKVNDRTVRLIVSKINLLLRAHEVNENPNASLEVEASAGHVAVMIPGRWYIAYFA